MLGSVQLRAQRWVMMTRNPNPMAHGGASSGWQPDQRYCCLGGLVKSGSAAGMTPQKSEVSVSDAWIQRGPIRGQPEESWRRPE
jgi:hypothetical protein